MVAETKSTQLRIAEQVFRLLAKAYIAIHRPEIVAVGGSVGKTSTKLMLAKFLEAEKKVSYMDDSYNNGIGLYLSVFERKVPSRGGASAWIGVLVKALGHFFRHRDIIVLEYGIDNPGDMDEMVQFARPDAAILTAVTPEHMEFLKTIDIVGEEETKIIKACKKFGVINTIDVDAKYTEAIKTVWYSYGTEGADASYVVKQRTAESTKVDFDLEGEILKDQKTILVADALIRQMTGALLMAKKMGISDKALQEVIPRILPAASRMHPLKGIKGSMLIDDSANFSPVAGVMALKTLKQVPATRRIAILGNMHELGDFIDEGYAQVGQEFEGVDILVLVGELSIEHFGRIAQAGGFEDGKNLYNFINSIEAGVFVRDNVVKEGDVVLIKGPFGGYYLEEATKKLLANPDDKKYVTRQSDFWDRKKRAHFGAAFDES